MKINDKMTKINDYLPRKTAIPLEAEAVAPAKIGRKEIDEASVILQKYKAGKKNLENRIIENEKWYRLQHFDHDEHSALTKSAWLFNNVANKHADAMDAFPSANILPREEGDKEEAEKLSAIIPVILQQNDFEKVYSEGWNRKLVGGTCAYGVFWDTNKLNGLGDVSVKGISVLNLFWEPGVDDIQSSPNLFHVELVDNEVLQALYPDLPTNVLGNSGVVSHHIYDEAVSTDTKTAVVDWYYKRQIGKRTVLHFAKFIGNHLLFASENDEKYAERGWYDHGMYPFELDSLYPIEGSPCGFGTVDVSKGPQGFIDEGNRLLLKNMKVNASPKYFYRLDGSINIESLADSDNDFIPVDGNLGQDAILPVSQYPLNDVYPQMITSKIEEMKETTGNRDISNGGTSSGVTAASAIAAMQEAGSKLSRDMIKASYRVFRRVCYLIVENIRQFYDVPRSFRITGNTGGYDFVKFSNKNIVPQHQGTIAGEDMGFRNVYFDIEITAQKASPYSKMAQNELALQFYNAGFFNPQMVDQALMCLEMMDFDRKSFIMNKISEQGTLAQKYASLQQQAFMLAQIVDKVKGNGPVLSSQLATQFGMETPAMHIPSGDVEMPSEEIEEDKGTAKARQRVAEAIIPN